MADFKAAMARDRRSKEARAGLARVSAAQRKARTAKPEEVVPEKTATAVVTPTPDPRSAKRTEKKTDVAVTGSTPPAAAEAKPPAVGKPKVTVKEAALEPKPEMEPKAEPKEEPKPAVHPVRAGKSPAHETRRERLLRERYERERVERLRLERARLERQRAERARRAAQIAAYNRRYRQPSAPRYYRAGEYDVRQGAGGYVVRRRGEATFSDIFR
jgi:hypothetical protein